MKGARSFCWLVTTGDERAADRVEGPTRSEGRMRSGAFFRAAPALIWPEDDADADEEEAEACWDADCSMASKSSSAMLPRAKSNESSCRLMSPALSSEARLLMLLLLPRASRAGAVGKEVGRAPLAGEDRMPRAVVAGSTGRDPSTSAWAECERPKVEPGRDRDDGFEEELAVGVTVDKEEEDEEA